MHTKITSWILAAFVISGAVGARLPLHARQYEGGEVGVLTESGTEATAVVQEPESAAITEESLPSATADTFPSATGESLPTAIAESATIDIEESTPWASTFVESVPSATTIIEDPSSSTSVEVESIPSATAATSSTERIGVLEITRPAGPSATSCPPAVTVTVTKTVSQVCAPRPTQGIKVLKVPSASRGTKTHRPGCTTICPAQRKGTRLPKIKSKTQHTGIGRTKPRIGKTKTQPGSARPNGDKKPARTTSISVRIQAVETTQSSVTTTAVHTSNTLHVSATTVHRTTSTVTQPTKTTISEALSILAVPTVHHTAPPAHVTVATVAAPPAHLTVLVHHTPLVTATATHPTHVAAPAIHVAPAPY
ncbi:hypothetical protein HDU89_008036 [Geranomyces variabilis]|nr:hypothetical protein HDU89_008036 [Geranomyces variabilis]